MPDLTVALLQTFQHWHDPAANRAHFERLIESTPPVDLMVLPEMFSTGFTMASEEMAETMQGPTVAWLQELANERQTNICGSVIIEDHNQYFNRFLLLSPDLPPRYYDKRHLFRMANEHEHFSPGAERMIVTINHVRICPMVCYDLRFPVYMRNQDDYDLALVIANWPAQRRQHWRTLLTARAIENQSYVIGLNRIGEDGNGIRYSGDSGLINANGDWQADLNAQEGVVVVEIDLAALTTYRESFPAWRDADPFSLSSPDAHSQS